MLHIALGMFKEIKGRPQDSEMFNHVSIGTTFLWACELLSTFSFVSQLPGAVLDATSTLEKYVWNVTCPGER